MISNWFNYKTGEYENLTEAPVERMCEFIPQDGASQSLFEIYTKHKGLDPIEASIKILEVVARV